MPGYYQQLRCAQLSIDVAELCYKLMEELPEGGMLGIQPDTAYKVDKALLKTVRSLDRLYEEITGRNFVAQPRTSIQSLPGAREHLRFVTSLAEGTPDDLLPEMLCSLGEDH